MAELTAPARLIGLDPLQVILLPCARRIPPAPNSRARTSVGTGLHSPRSAALDGPCPDLSSEGEGAAKAVGKSEMQEVVNDGLGNSSPARRREGASDKGSEAVDKAEEVIATALLVLGAHLDLDSDKDATHFRHESGDTSRDVHFTATATFHSPIDGREPDLLGIRRDRRAARTAR